MTETTHDPALKGKKNGNCNRQACQKAGAIYYNVGTGAYYCEPCARRINREMNESDRATCLTAYGVKTLCLPPQILYPGVDDIQFRIACQMFLDNHEQQLVVIVVDDQGHQHARPTYVDLDLTRAKRLVLIGEFGRCEILDVSKLRKVTKEEFYVTVGQMNVHPRTANKFYDAWRLLANDKLVGVSLPGWRNPGHLNPDTYFVVVDG